MSTPLTPALASGIDESTFEAVATEKGQKGAGWKTSFTSNGRGTGRGVVA